MVWFKIKHAFHWDQCNSKKKYQPNLIRKSSTESYLTWSDDRLKNLLTGIMQTDKRKLKLGIMNGILRFGQGFSGTSAMVN